MANPQNTPADQDMNITGNNPNRGDFTDDDMHAGAPMQSDDEMGATEPFAYDEETDNLIETPVEAEGAESAHVQRAENEGMTPSSMNYAGGAAPEDTESDYSATPNTRTGAPQGSSPSATGVEGAGSREPGGTGMETANSGLAGTDTTSSNSGVVGQGLSEDDETLPPNV